MVKEKPVEPVVEDPIDEGPAPMDSLAPAEVKIPTLKAGGVYKGFHCMGGMYTGEHRECGHFEDLTEDECWKKCMTSASAGGDEKCDKETGVPECVAMVWDKGPPDGPHKERSMCMLHRECTELMAPPPEFAAQFVTKLKDTYHPTAARFETLEDARCTGEPYTRPDDEKKGLEDVDEEECKEACFMNKWPGSKDVEVRKCAAAVYYIKKRYCDFYDEDECEKTKEKKGYITFKKVPPGEAGEDGPSSPGGYE
jgi:hypothetical protein